MFHLNQFFFCSSWADECIRKFSVGGGLHLDDVFNGPREIYKGSKTIHLKNISKKTGKPLQEMVFFDDQYGNCKDVSSTGATVVYTPEGLTRERFQEAIDNFPAPGRVLGPKRKGPMFW